MTSQSCAATLTHYSTEPLTTGPDYDPLLLLLSLAVNPGLPRYPCSVCFKNVTSQGTSYLCTRCSHWVHSRCSGLRNVADYHRANCWICTACRTLPQPRAPSPSPSPAHMPTILDKTFNILQCNANGIGNKQTELSIFLEAQYVKVAAIQESKLTVKSRGSNIQNYTLLRQDRRLGPGGGLLFFIHNSVSFSCKPLSTTSKNDPHLEELTISIAMDNTELLITNVYIPPASSCRGCYSPPLDHMLTGTNSLVLGYFNAHHSLWHSGTADTRGNQLAEHFQLCSPEYRFIYKAPWKCRPEFSRCIISISLSHHLVQIANTHDHDFRPSAHPYRITDNFHLISCPAQNLDKYQEG